MSLPFESSDDEDFLLVYYFLTLRRRKLEKKKTKRRKSWIYQSAKQGLDTTLEHQKINEASLGLDIHIKTESKDPLLLPQTSYESEILDIKIECEETESTSFIKRDPSETESDLPEYEETEPTSFIKRDPSETESDIPEYEETEPTSFIKTEPSEIEFDIASDSSKNNVLNPEDSNDIQDKEGSTEIVPKMAKPVKRRAISSPSTSRRPKS